MGQTVIGRANPLPFYVVLHTITVKLMITVSPNAKDYITQLMAENKASSEAFVRVGVKSGGCSGLEYKLDFDTVQKEGDQVFEDKGVRVVVDMKSLLYLYGTELDYSGGLNGKGLTFNNPNASRTCSCGESFSV
jgi:iron-sulfur cluster assembly protein